MTLWRSLQADHDRIWDLVNTITGGADPERPSAADQRRLARDLVALQSCHELAEEVTIWPVVRARCDDGDALVEEALRQEADLKRALNELVRIDAGTEEFDVAIHTVAGQERNHLTYEEHQIWPRLAHRLSEEDAERLRQAWIAARSRAPTRPHPHLPAGPRVVGTVGALLAVPDRVRDAVRGRRVPDAA